jgi:hypothetical protein
MISTSVRMTVAVFAAALALPGSLTAQSFKVDRFDIGGTGGTDYVTAEAGTGRVFVSRSTHVMVVDGPTGQLLGDIPTPASNHGIALSEKSGHGFITANGDSTVVMFDLKSLVVIKSIKIPTGGLDGIMYDDFQDRIILTNHSRPIGTVVVLDAKSGDIAGTVNLDDSGPEGAASDGKGTIFVNLEGKAEIQVVDVKVMKSVAIWPIAPCEGPTGIALDRTTNRIFSGCGTTSVVVDSKSGKVIAQIANGDGVDALGWDQAQKLIYIPAGRAGNVTVAHEDSPDKYTVVGTVTTQPGAKTIAVDPVKHMAYLFQPEFGPAPAPDPNAPPPTGRGRGPRGPLIHAWFIAISH